MRKTLKKLGMFEKIRFGICLATEMRRVAERTIQSPVKHRVSSSMMTMMTMIFMMKTMNK